MRVFYTEETEELEHNLKQYFITIENIDIPNHLKGTKAFDAKSVIELKSKIIDHYKFILPKSIELQLWSGPTGTICKIIDDNMPEICHVWVRAVNNT